MNMFRNNKLMTIARFALMFVMLASLALPALVKADADTTSTGGLDLGIEKVGGATGLGKKDIRETIGAIIKVSLGFLGVVAIVVVLIGGFKYMIAGGSEEKVTEAKKWIISGVIGLAIILSAYAITSFVITSLMSATADSGTTE